MLNFPLVNFGLVSANRGQTKEKGEHGEVIRKRAKAPEDGIHVSLITYGYKQLAPWILTAT